MALASTVVGGGIATVSAGFLDQRRWRRDRGEQQLETRRVLYGSYLAALAKARQTCSLMAREREMPADQRRRAVWDAFEPCVSLRYEVAIAAPSAVVTLAEDTYRCLRDILVIISDGLLSDSDEYAAGRTRYDEVHLALRRAMRVDLGAEP